jgi:crotonobetainyl-CoA:carnitine CoA-transferase CaiB-like acyl-CoA transferase
MNAASGAGPLAGVRILDFTAMVSGPGATAILSSQGAEVIKIEPLLGDLIRTSAPNERGLSAGFITLNRGKRSLSIDLKSERGLAIVLKLLPTADVVLQNFRTGVMERLGLSEEAIRRVSPNIIKVDMGGFGRKGPLANNRVYDPLVQAMSGMAALQRQNDAEPPQAVRTIVPDTVMGFAAAQAISAALFARERTCKGQTIDMSMLGVMIAFMWPSAMSNHTFLDWNRGAAPQPSMQNVVYATIDGYIAINVLSDREWVGLCRALEVNEWKSIPSFATAMDRQMNAGEVREAISKVILTRGSEQWLERLSREDVPCAPVLTGEDLIEHEQIVANGFIKIIDHPQVGRIRQPARWASFSEQSADQNAAAPLIGQDNQALLNELGYSDQQIDALAEEGVIGRPPAKG